MMEQAIQHAPGTRLAQGGGYPPGGYGPPGSPPGGPGGPGGYGPPGGPGGYGGPPGGPGGYGPPPGPGGYGGGPPDPYGPPAPPYGAPYPPVAGPPYGGVGGSPNPELKKQAQTWLIISAASFVLCSSCFGVIGAVLCYMAMQAVDQGNIPDAENKLKWGKIISGAGIGIMIVVIIAGIALTVLGGVGSALSH